MKTLALTPTRQTNPTPTAEIRSPLPTTTSPSSASKAANAAATAAKAAQAEAKERKEGGSPKITAINLTASAITSDQSDAVSDDAQHQADQSV